MICSEIITALSDLLVGAAAIITACAAIIGLKSWQRELKGKAEFDTARDLIKSTYKLRDEVRACRSPFISAHEFPESYKKSSENHSTDEEVNAWIHVYMNRWASITDAVQVFDTQTLEAEAIWGSEIRQKTDMVRACIQSLYAAIDAFISNKRSDGNIFKDDKEFAKKILNELNTIGDSEVNEFSIRISNAISEVDNFIRPHLRRI